MTRIKKYSKITLVLSSLSILALIISHFALTDIYHGEEDLSMEWTFLRIAAVIILAFIISTIFTLIQVLKKNQ
jgi:type II secretory pathway component PulL